MWRHWASSSRSDGEGNWQAAYGCEDCDATVGLSALNSLPLSRPMTGSNFPSVGSAVLVPLNSLPYGEFLGQLERGLTPRPEWIQNIADIMMAFDWENEEEKKLMLKWTLKEKYVTAVNP